LKIELYDIVELLEDLNPKIVREMQGTVIAKYYDNIFEVEFVDANGYTIGYMDQLTFKVTRGQIMKVASGPLKPRK
jgi:hypothetical protein